MAHTGFGRVGREMALGLIAKGHDVRVIAINWRGVLGEIGAAINKDRKATIPQRLMSVSAEIAADPLLEVMMPAGEHGDGMGHNLTLPALRGQLWPGWKPEAMVFVADPRAMFGRLTHDGGAHQEAKRKGIRSLNYVPIEGTNLPPSMRLVYDYAEPVAMSAFGKAQLETLLGREVPMFYHGISEVFRPITPLDPGRHGERVIETRDAAKEVIGARGQTIILRTDRYIFRKNYPAFFRVIRPVLEAHPEVRALIHTVLMDDLGQGDIRESLSREPGAVHSGGYDWWHPQITFTKAHDSYKGLDDEGLRLLYNAADVYVSPTMAEGFGLCLAESLACGTAGVATDYSAIPEVVGPGGVLIPPRDYITNGYAHEWALVDEAAMSAAVERLVGKPALRRQLGEAGRRHVRQFTWSAMVDGFDHLLETAAPTA